jgi:hypothetical protein
MIQLFWRLVVEQRNTKCCHQTDFLDFDALYVRTYVCTLDMPTCTPTHYGTSILNLFVRFSRLNQSRWHCMVVVAARWVGFQYQVPGTGTIRSPRLPVCGRQVQTVQSCVQSTSTCSVTLHLVFWSQY